MNYFLSVLKKYAVFSGRASRAEYWYFFLYSIFIAFGLALIEALLGTVYATDENILSNIYQLAMIIPSITVGVRRMHDVNKSGWFVLIPIYNLILAVTNGTKGNNKYGPDPKTTKTK